MQARDGTPACRLHPVAAQAEVVNVVSVPSDQRNAEGKGGGSQRSWWPWRRHEGCGPGLVEVRTAEGAEAVGAVEVTAPWVNDPSELRDSVATALCNHLAARWSVLGCR